MPEKIRTLIVDDEAPARARVRNFLKDITYIEVVGESANGRTTVTDLENLKPDLVFLDIQMPAPDGLSALKKSAFKPAAVVFVTAFEDFAIEAFEVNAVDYLLKPFSRQRLTQTLQRVRARLQETGGVATEAVDSHLNSPLSSEPVERLAIKDLGKTTYVRVADIIWIESEGNYAKLHTPESSFLMRESLKALESILPAKQFHRIHRTAIVNVQQVQAIEPYFHGDAFLTLKSGPRLRVSRQRRAELEKLLGR